MAKRKGRAPGIAIQAYLEKHRISQQDFADKVGVSQGLVSQWIKGRSRVTPRLAPIVIRETEGELTREALFPELYSDTVR